jgi:hypothetical protein
MGNSNSRPNMEESVPRTAVGKPFDGLPRLCLAGMHPSHNAANSKKLFDHITDKYANKYATWCIFFKRSSKSPYFGWYVQPPASCSLFPP